MLLNVKINFLAIVVSSRESSTDFLFRTAAMKELELAVDGFIDDADLEERCRQQLNNVEYEVSGKSAYASCAPWQVHL